MSYQLLKLIHIVSATLMIGAGIGSAFYLYLTYKRYEAATVKDVLKLVILADSIFTAPSVVIQFVSGFMLSKMLKLTYTNWFWASLALSLVVLILWLRAAFIQYRLRRMLDEEHVISPAFDRQMKIWFYLGVPAFLGALCIYYLMVFKPFL